MDRGDMNPAFGIVRSVLLGLLIWAAAGFVSLARAESFWTCSTDAPPVNLYCGGYMMPQPEEAIADYGMAVSICLAADASAGSVVAGDSFSACGGEMVWRYAWDVSAGDFASSSSLGNTLWPVESLAFWGASPPSGGGGGDPAPDDFDIADLDLDNAFGAFSAAFIVYALFWALGKGVAIVVNAARGRF